MKSSHLASNELQVARALRVAVSSPVLGTSLVRRILGHAAVGIHLHEVYSTIEATREIGSVNIHGELHVQSIEDLIGGIGVHEVDAGADVLLTAIGHELEGDGVARGGDTVGAGVAGALKSAVGSTSGGVVRRAERGIPGVTGVAVGRAGSRMKPAPVGVDGDRPVLVSAATSDSALLPGDGGVNLWRQGADLLGSSNGKESG